MEIIAHRGFWLKPEEKNLFSSLVRALDQGYGIETDIRDKEGKLVISHDMPIGEQLYLEELFSYYHNNNCESCLALNIKSDGLAEELMSLITRFDIRNYFVFDMSVPDTLHYIKMQMNVYVRHSEVEVEPVLYDKTSGVWLDMFYDDWVTNKILNSHVSNNKGLCLVSPELHRRAFEPFWQKLRGFSGIDKLMLCTDYPDKAKDIFNE